MKKYVRKTVRMMQVPVQMRQDGLYLVGEGREDFLICKLHAQRLFPRLGFVKHTLVLSDDRLNASSRWLQVDQVAETCRCNGYCTVRYLGRLMSGITYRAPYNATDLLRCWFGWSKKRSHGYRTVFVTLLGRYKKART